MAVRRFRRAAALGIGIAAPLALIGAAVAQPRHQETPKKASEVYNNIKVLKDVPAPQLLPIMHNWSQSLGVQCTFCHVVETDAAGKHVGFEKDEKPEKEMARKMVQMVKDINARQKIVDKKITCYTCHHGQKAPEGVPPAPK